MDFAPKKATGGTMTICWAVVVFLMVLGFLTYWANWGMFLSPVVESILLAAGGIMMLLESVFEGKKFSFKKLETRPFDALGLVLGTIALVLSIGTYFSVSFIIAIFGGFTGIIYLLLAVLLVVEGYFNRN